MPVVRDIMSQRVVTIRPDATLSQAVKTLVEHDINGAPVVLDDGAMVGIISQLALMDVLFDHAMRDVPVSECMTREVHSTGPDDSLSHVAHMFILYGIRRLPVVEDGALVGIVSCSDLLRYAMQCAEPLSEPLVELIPPLGRMT